MKVIDDFKNNNKDIKVDLYEKTDDFIVIGNTPLVDAIINTNNDG